MKHYARNRKWGQYCDFMWQYILVCIPSIGNRVKIVTQTLTNIDEESSFGTKPCIAQRVSTEDEGGLGFKGEEGYVEKVELLKNQTL